MDAQTILWHNSIKSTSCTATTIRPWKFLDIDLFRTNLSASGLCQPDDWFDCIDDIVGMYIYVMCELLDQFIPSRSVIRRPRAADPWFDSECQAAKRATRKLKRAYSAACRWASSDVPAAAAIDAAKAAWYAHRHVYSYLRRRKRSDFWALTFEADWNNPWKLWQFVDRLLGRRRVPVSDVIDVADFSRFFAEKVDKVRRSTQMIQHQFSLRWSRVLSCLHLRRLPLMTSSVQCDDFQIKLPPPTHFLRRFWSWSLKLLLHSSLNRSLATNLNCEHEYIFLHASLLKIKKHVYAYWYSSEQHTFSIFECQNQLFITWNNLYNRILVILDSRLRAIPNMQQLTAFNYYLT